MMENKEDYYLSLIEKYVNLDLSESELELVEEKLQNDEAFITSFRLYQESQAIVNEYRPDSAKQKTYGELAQVLANNSKKQGRGITMNTAFAVVAASIAILIVTVFLIHNSEEERDLKLMAQQAWDQDIGLDYRQVRNTENDSARGVLLLGFDYYDQNDYQNSIDALQDFKAGDLYFEDVLLIRGLSNYQLGNREKAIDLLSTLKEFPTGKKANVAKWYLGLIYLSENNELEAGKYIEIPDNPDTGIKIIE
ncbi:MAG: hypothetical protein AAFQ94_20325 [Bacteroidota bacterium]